jgi:hypothetical protein
MEVDEQRPSTLSKTLEFKALGMFSDVPKGYARLQLQGREAGGEQSNGDSNF